MKKLFVYIFLLMSFFNSYSQKIQKLVINGYESFEIAHPDKSGIIVLESQEKHIEFIVFFDNIVTIDSCWVTKNENLYRIITPAFKDGDIYKFKLQLNGNIDKIDLLIGFNQQIVNFNISRILLPKVPVNIQTSYKIFSGGIGTEIEIQNITNTESIDIKYGLTEQSPIKSDGQVINSIKYSYNVYKETNKIVFKFVSTIDTKISAIPLLVKIKESNVIIPLITLELDSETPDSKQITFSEKSFFFKPNKPQSTSSIISNSILESSIGNIKVKGLLKDKVEYFLKNNKDELVATLIIKTISEDLTGNIGKKIDFELNTIKIYKGIASIWDNKQKILLTDIEIKANPKVEKVELLKDSEWSKNLSVHPGERILIKISGENLINTNLAFSTNSITTIPQTTNTNNVAIYEINIAENIREKEVDILINDGVITVIKVEEYQIPCPLNYFTSINNDFLKLTSGDYNYSPISFSKLNNHLILNFDASRIDNDEKLYGIQYLLIEINVYDNENKIIGVPISKKFFILPTKGARASQYKKPNSDIYNEILGNSIDIKDLLPSEPKLNNLNDYSPWETIEISISTDETVYKTKGYKKRIVLINKKSVVIKPSLTIPAGLYVYREGGMSNATGISATALYQLQFYRGNKNRIPLNFGMGFIGLDAINFISNQDSSDNKGTQDLGIVSIITIDNFIKPDRKSNISFAIHLGGGYLLNNKKWFWLIGPGISINIGN